MNVDQAAEVLRERALAVAAKKSERAVKEGLIGHYIHTGSKVAALIEVGCESDFVARTEEFQALCRELAMQVVAAKPTWVRPEDVPADQIEQLKAEAIAAAADKPPRLSRRSSRASWPSSTKRTACWNRPSSRTRASRSRT